MLRVRYLLHILIQYIRDVLLGTFVRPLSEIRFEEIVTGRLGITYKKNVKWVRYFFLQ